MRKVIVIFFLAFSISLLAQGLNELLIVGKAVKTNDIVSSSIKDVNNRKASCIIFLTDLEVDMDFKPNIELVKLISKAGRYEVYVQPGERVIEVFASGFKPLNLVLSSYGISKLESGDVYQVEITGEKFGFDIPIVILSDPAGAEIFLDDISYGTEKNISTNIGKHKLRLIKSGYSTKAIDINVSKEKSLFEFKLTEIEDAIVIIDTNPDDATIIIDGVNIGISPVSTFFPPGSYSIEIVKKDYESISETINIQHPQTKKIYNLTDNRASLSVNTHEKARVYIDDVEISNRFNIKISPKIITVRVEMLKCAPIEQRIILKAKENKTISLFPELQYGTVQVAVIPSDASIRLYENGGVEYMNNGAKIFRDVPVGSYQLEVYKEGYDISKEEFIINDSDLIKKSIKLQKLSEDTIMNACKLILSLETNASFNIKKIQSESKLNASIQGNYVYWTEKYDNLVDHTKNARVVGGEYSNLLLKIAISQDGKMLIGTIGSNEEDHLRVFATSLGLQNYGYFNNKKGIHKYDVTEYKDFYTDNSIKQNFLAYYLNKIYDDFYSKNYILSGPSDNNEFYKCKTKLLNNFQHPITVIKSALRTHQMDYGNFKKDYTKLEQSRNFKWSPIGKRPDQNKDIGRYFSLTYSRDLKSCVAMYTYSDNGMSSLLSVDNIKTNKDFTGKTNHRGYGKSYIRFDSSLRKYSVTNNGCASAQLYLVNEFPNNIIMQGNTNWSTYDTKFIIAVLGGETAISKVKEKPTYGDDNNPNPYKKIINVGWNQ